MIKIRIGIRGSPPHDFGVIQCDLVCLGVLGCDLATGWQIGVAAKIGRERPGTPRRVGRKSGGGQWLE